METALLQVEVAYAEPNQQLVLPVELPTEATLAEALIAALPALQAAFPTVDFTMLAVGVWGEAANLERVLQAGDRVELYRPLTADPKLARRTRVDQAAKRRATLRVPRPGSSQ
jgi:putative ubiquitin-RnfH superfamily antitoxin RatB of RatAB toxin-antitoxin module